MPLFVLVREKNNYTRRKSMLEKFRFGLVIVAIAALGLFAIACSDEEVEEATNTTSATGAAAAAKDSGADTVKFQYWNPKFLKPGVWDSDGRREIYNKAALTEEKILQLQNISMYLNLKLKYLLHKDLN